jgi:hypothetical protein
VSLGNYRVSEPEIKCSFAWHFLIELLDWMGSGHGFCHEKFKNTNFLKFSKNIL